MSEKVLEGAAETAARVVEEEARRSEDGGGRGARAELTALRPVCHSDCVQNER